MPHTYVFTKEEVLTLFKKLTKEVLDNPSRLHSVCHDLMTTLSQLDMTPSLLEDTMAAKTLTKISKYLKRQKRMATSTSKDEDTTTTAGEWGKLVVCSEAVLRSWKKLVLPEKKEVENKSTQKGATATNTKNEFKTNKSKEPDLPKSVSEYRARLVRQHKELFKDPPVLPPESSLSLSTSSFNVAVVVYPSAIEMLAPKRDKVTGALTFPAGNTSDKEFCQLLKEFHPNRTPEEILRSGAFGGTYFRPIVSAVTNQSYTACEVLKDTVDDNWIQGLDVPRFLTSTIYREQVNKYGVKCGGTLGMWESSGWISAVDPYGWFQWYCRFYRGRRCFDDARQISRWLKSAGPKGRFRSQLCNKILAAETKTERSSSSLHDDASISPVIRQTLMHWGLEITPQVLERHRERVGK